VKWGDPCERVQDSRVPGKLPLGQVLNQGESPYTWKNVDSQPRRATPFPWKGGWKVDGILSKTASRFIDKNAVSGGRTGTKGGSLQGGERTPVGKRTDQPGGQRDDAENKRTGRKKIRKIP